MSTAPDQPSPQPACDDALVVQDTVRWLERAVIGLNLCPFAKGVHTKDQIHYAVSHATDARELLQDLQRELEALKVRSRDVLEHIEHGLPMMQVNPRQGRSQVLDHAADGDGATVVFPSHRK